jgi:hypothetical protein
MKIIIKNKKNIYIKKKILAPVLCCLDWGLAWRLGSSGPRVGRTPQPWAPALSRRAWGHEGSGSWAASATCGEGCDTALGRGPRAQGRWGLMSLTGKGLGPSQGLRFHGLRFSAC